MELVVRKISIKDADAVQALSKQLGYELSIEATATQIKKIIQSQDNCAFVAVTGETVIGWIHGFKTLRLETKPFIEIGGLVVDANYQQKGIGKRLVDKVKEWCKAQGIHSLRVRSNTKRLEAHQFYLRLGFDEQKEQKVFAMNV